MQLDRFSKLKEVLIDSLFHTRHQQRPSILPLSLHILFCSCNNHCSHRWSLQHNTTHVNPGCFHGRTCDISDVERLLRPRGCQLKSCKMDMWAHMTAWSRESSYLTRSRRFIGVSALKCKVCARDCSRLKAGCKLCWNRFFSSSSVQLKLTGCSSLLDPIRLPSQRRCHIIIISNLSN